MRPPIIVRPARLKGKDGWEVYESDQVCPFFGNRRYALNYAIPRGSGARGLEVHDAEGNVIRSIDAKALAELAHRIVMGDVYEEG